MIFRYLDTAKPQDWPLLVALAKSAELVRGYGHIKGRQCRALPPECARLGSSIGQPVVQAPNRFPAVGRGFSVAGMVSG
jgi:indolepyruvate ferredoxin oxidoreductase